MTKEKRNSILNRFADELTNELELFKLSAIIEDNFLVLTQDELSYAVSVGCYSGIYSYYIENTKNGKVTNTGTGIQVVQILEMIFS